MLEMGFWDDTKALLKGLGKGMHRKEMKEKKEPLFLHRRRSS